MSFDFEKHTRDQCIDYFGGDGCYTCDPENHREPALSFTFKITEQNREAIRIAFGPLVRVPGLPPEGTQ